MCSIGRGFGTSPDPLSLPVWLFSIRALRIIVCRPPPRCRVAVALNEARSFYFCFPSEPSPAGIKNKQRTDTMGRSLTALVAACAMVSLALFMCSCILVGSAVSGVCAAAAASAATSAPPRVLLTRVISLSLNAPILPAPPTLCCTVSRPGGQIPSHSFTNYSRCELGSLFFHLISQINPALRLRRSAVAVALSRPTQERCQRLPHPVSLFQVRLADDAIIYGDLSRACSKHA